MNASRAVALFVAIALGCSSGKASPSILDTKNDSCAFCRMPVSDAHLAAQLAAPGEETKFFDDIGCLRDFLEQNAPPRTETVAYVADHRTEAWIRASAAVFSRCPALETPMGSHLIARTRMQSPAITTPLAGNAHKLRISSGRTAHPMEQANE